METERRTGNGLPPSWGKVPRHRREDAKTERKRTPADEDLLELITAPGWTIFVTEVSAIAKLYHHALIAQVSTDPVRYGNQGALATLNKIFAHVYERAGIPMPEYLKMLLQGVIE